MTSVYKQVELTEAQKQIIRDTVPTLKAAGEELTKNFYQKMFKDYPDVKPFFNQTDQKLMRQPKILAFALLKYAENIDDLTPLTDFVLQIVAKHVGLQVRAGDYEAVGNLLIATMKEMLGDAATDDFIGAWAAAYGNLASLLIGLESAEYKKNDWQGFKPFKVTKIVDECKDVKSIYFKPEDGHIQKAVPGQYVCIRWNVPGFDYEQLREYSLSAVTNDTYRISVKHLPGGLVSTFIHENLKEGDVLKVAPPEGKFVFKEDKDSATFIAGGIGITPILAILEDILPKGKKAKLLYCNRDANRPFVAQLSQWSKDYNLEVVEYISLGADVTDVTDAIGTLNAKRLAPADVESIKSDVFLLGPRPMMKEYLAKFAELGVTPTYEYFGPTDV